MGENLACSENLDIASGPSSPLSIDSTPPLPIPNRDSVSFPSTQHGVSPESANSLKTLDGSPPTSQFKTLADGPFVHSLPKETETLESDPGDSNGSDGTLTVANSVAPRDDGSDDAGSCQVVVVTPGYVGCDDFTLADNEGDNYDHVRFQNVSSCAGNPRYRAAPDGFCGDDRSPDAQEEPEQVKSTGVGAGLFNLGNTCFINSVLQCFTHTVPLIRSLGLHGHPMPCECSSKGFCVICSLRGHIELAFTKSGDLISPSRFVDNLNYFSTYFQKYQQEDAHEFLQSFLDKLEKCCLDSKKKEEPLSSQVVNIVEHVFGGRLVSRLRCCNCGSFSDTHEASVGLSLEIEDVDNLQSALESFTCVEKLDDLLSCDSCNEKVSKQKQLMLDQAPLVATFHLKRFKNNGFFVEKIYKHVNFPLELDLQPFMIGGETGEACLKYRLYALVEHIGVSLTSGHYFSYVRSSPYTWHKLDDSKVSRVQEQDVLLQDAYILFYVREDTPWFSDVFELVKSITEENVSNSSPKSVLETAYNDCTSDQRTESMMDNCMPKEPSGVLGETSSVSPSGPEYEGLEAKESKVMADGISKFSNCESIDDVTMTDLEKPHNTDELEKPHNTDELEKPCASPACEETNLCQSIGRVVRTTEDAPASGSPSPNGSSRRHGEGSFRIRRGHLKVEKEEKTRKRTSTSKVPEALDKGIALRYLKKHSSSSRALLLSAAMGCSPHGSAIKRKKRVETPQCKRAGGPHLPRQHKYERVS